MQKSNYVRTVAESLLGVRILVYTDTAYSRKVAFNNVKYKTSG